MNFKTITTTTLAILVLAACSKADDVHNLSVDEGRRAKTYAEAFFNEEHPAGMDDKGNLTKKKGSFQACRPQDSNSNGLVTCTGMLPNLQGGFVQVTRYCGYESGNSAVLGCSDKDQK
jgi:hypothetical protein